jgi:hypothetical protein
MVEVEVAFLLTVSQYVSVSSPFWDLRPDITSCRNVAGFPYVAFCDSQDYGGGTLTLPQ